MQARRVGQPARLPSTEVACYRGIPTPRLEEKGGEIEPPRPVPLDYFSFRTPLKGFLSDLTSMKRPVFSSRLTQ